VKAVLLSDGLLLAEKTEATAVLEVGTLLDNATESEVASMVEGVTRLEDFTVDVAIDEDSTPSAETETELLPVEAVVGTVPVGVVKVVGAGIELVSFRVKALENDFDGVDAASDGEIASLEDRADTVNNVDGVSVDITTDEL